MDETTKKILRGQICPYCGSKTELAPSKEIYGQNFGYIYICRPCKAWVWCHEGTTKSLWRVADAELRRWKHRAHESFDRLWKRRLVRRWESYGILAEHLGIDREYCHIGMFDIELCQKTEAFGLSELTRRLEERRNFYLINQKTRW